MKVRKKPVIVEAERFVDWEQDDDGKQFTILHGKRFDVYHDATDESRAVIFVQTLEGTMSAPLGYWIMKGVEGELYPCQPDIFDKTYEIVND